MQNIAVTVSIGISGVPDENIDAEDKLIRCADIALYTSKQDGRNRTVVADGKSLIEI
jgi:diguanylate cyclase (GGDEF)-like protein